MKGIIVIAALLTAACGGSLEDNLAAQSRGVDPRAPNGAGQNPAFPGQTDAPEQKTNVRLSVDDGKVTGEERLLRDLGERIRDVVQGPDGALYLLTDNAGGRVLKLAPKGR